MRLFVLYRNSFSKFCLIFILVSINHCLLKAQVQSGHISAGFVEHHSVLPLNVVASNILRIRNTTNTAQTLSIKLVAPPGWRKLGIKYSDIVVESQDSIFLPVRFLLNQNAKSNQAYPISVEVYSKDFIIGNDSWFVEIEKITDWNIDLQTSKFVFKNNNDTAHVKLYAFNAGNSEELIHLDLKKISNELKIIDGRGQSIDKMDFVLGTGIDTVISIAVIYEDEFIGESEYHLQDKAPNTKRVSMRITAHDDNPKISSRFWNGSVSFEKVPNIYEYTLNSTENLPMTLEMNSYNVLEDKTFLSAIAYGQKRFEDYSYLTYQYQTNFVSNLLDWNTFLGQYHYLGYFSPIWSAEIGNVMLGRSGISVNGVGAKGGYQYKRHYVGAGILTMPKLIDNYLGYGGAFEYGYTSIDKRLKADAYFLFKNQTYIERQVKAFIPSISYATRDNHYFKLELGYSKVDEEVRKMGISSLDGYGYRFNYSGRINKISLNLSNRWSNPDYAGGKGILNFSAIVGYTLSKTERLMATVSHSAMKPNIYTKDTLIFSGLRSRTDRIELRYTKVAGKTSFFVKPILEHTFYNGLENTFYGTSLDVFSGSFKHFQHNFSIFSGYNVLTGTIPSYSFSENDFIFEDVSVNTPYFTSVIKYGIRYNDVLNLNFRYNYGPLYYYQKHVFAQTGENIQSFYLNGNYSIWFAHNKAMFRNGVNISYITTSVQSAIHYRPELLYYLTKGFRLSIYSQMSYNRSINNFSNIVENELSQQDLFSNKETIYNNIEVGFGLKKDFGLPVSLRKYFDVCISAFKDDDGNGHKSNAEDGVENILVQLELQSYLDRRGETTDVVEPVMYEVLSNNKGAALLSNIPMGNYLMTVIPLSGIDRIYSGSSREIVLHKDMLLEIPFASSASVSGVLTVERSNISRFTKPVRLGNIKVTAVSENGSSYSSLTDSQGAYRIDLPAGSYRLSINEKVLGRNLVLKENNIGVNLQESNRRSFVTFYLIERERKMNIKRFE